MFSLWNTEFISIICKLKTRKYKYIVLTCSIIALVLHFISKHFVGIFNLIWIDCMKTHTAANAYSASAHSWRGSFVLEQSTLICSGINSEREHKQWHSGCYPLLFQTIPEDFECLFENHQKPEHRRYNFVILSKGCNSNLWHRLQIKSKKGTTNQYLMMEILIWGIFTAH